MAGNHADVDHHIKKYIKVFIALLVLTGLTVWASHWEHGVAVGIAIGLTIAVTKGTLVAGYFMHLFDEKPILFWILGVMVILFFAILLLPALTFNNSLIMIDR